MEKPVSQWITQYGCIIQGVTKDNEEISYVYCPEHRKIEPVYSFKRKVNLKNPLSEIQKNTIARLRDKRGIK